MKNGVVLLVDDEKIIRETGSAMIEALGYNCTTASGGNDCLEKFYQNPKDIRFVILDVEMPDIKGHEVSEQLKKDFNGVKILFTSGYSKEHLEKNVFKKNIENFIAKPLDISELSLKIEKMLRE